MHAFVLNLQIWVHKAKGPRSKIFNKSAVQFSVTTMSEHLDSTTNTTSDGEVGIVT